MTSDQPPIFEITFTTNLVDGSQVPERTMRVQAATEDAAKEKLEERLTAPEMDQQPPIESFSYVSIRRVG